MEVVETQAYTFNELTQESKEKALKNLWYINVDREWWLSIYEDAANVCIKIKGFNIHRGNYITGDFIEDAPASAEAIKENHGEGCGTYNKAANFLIDSEYLIEESKKYGRYPKRALDDLGIKFLRSILKDYLSILREEYKYLRSDEAIIETIEAGDYEFTEDGALI